MTSSDYPAAMENATRHAALHYFRKPNTFEQFLKLGDVVKNIIGPNGCLPVLH
jgi:hypothetical protein